MEIIQKSGDQPNAQKFQQVGVAIKLNFGDDTSESEFSMPCRSESSISKAEVKCQIDNFKEMRDNLPIFEEKVKKDPKLPQHASEQINKKLIFNGLNNGSGKVAVVDDAKVLEKLPPLEFFNEEDHDSESSSDNENTDKQIKN